MKSTLVIVIVALLVGGGAFFAGTRYQQSKRPNVDRLFNGQGQDQMNRGRFGSGVANRNGFRPVNGEIISTDEGLITVKLTDGSSRIVILSEKTTISKTDTAAIAALRIGEKIAVIGTDNSDGSLTAQNIQLNPIMPDTSLNPNPTLPVTP